jgi:hypothetical protein
MGPLKEDVTLFVTPAHGQIKDIGGGGIHELIREDLNKSVKGGGYLGKEVCYIDSTWPDGEASVQSLGEKEILERNAKKIAQEFCESDQLTIFDLGAG